MENISHFLRACQMPPLSLPDHDVFLTVDLYESKDPAQVLQCIGAFSRRANAINPAAFPITIGTKTKALAISPQISGSSQGGIGRPLSGLEARARGMSNASDNSPTTWNPLAKGSYSGRVSPTKTGGLAAGGLASPGPVSSWSSRDDEAKTAPAWNIHQYGYMGGASQGNQGISFGARRQITSAAPSVPSLAEKERRRKEEQAEAERRKLEAEEAERQRVRHLETEEEEARLEEERRWEEATRHLREKERWEADEEKKRWDEEQRRWKEEEEQRLREEKESQLAAERNRKQVASDARLNGQFLSQYQEEQIRLTSNADAARSTSESERIKELERQLEEAKERERQYELERQGRQRNAQGPQKAKEPAPLPQTSSSAKPPTGHENDWDDSEREYLRKEWQNQKGQQMPPKPARPHPAEPVPVQVNTPPPRPIRPGALPTLTQGKTPAPPARPLPNPAAYVPGTNRADQYLASNPAPTAPQPVSHRPADYSTTTEVDLENQRRKEAQAKTKAGGWASKSLLEREMERERERQKEWEESQTQTAISARDSREGTGPGQSWDVHQYGYMGGDNQSRGGPGLGVGGARRQIIGPRPPP